MTNDKRRFLYNDILTEVERLRECIWEGKNIDPSCPTTVRITNKANVAVSNIEKAVNGLKDVDREIERLREPFEILVY